MIQEPILDARGVEITAGDTVIYGFGVSRSVAMAEGVVQAADHDGRQQKASDPWPVSLTPSGMIRIRVVRRSYDSGEKPVVAIHPDRVVVLKADRNQQGETVAVLPWSPQPTQDEELYDKTVANVERIMKDIKRLENGGPLDRFEIKGRYPDYQDADPENPELIKHYLARYRVAEASVRRTLVDVCQRLDKEVPV